MLYSRDGLYTSRPVYCSLCSGALDERPSLCILTDENFQDWTTLSSELIHSDPISNREHISCYAYCNRECLKTALRSKQYSGAIQKLNNLIEDRDIYRRDNQKSIQSLIGFPTINDQIIERTMKWYQERIDWYRAYLE